MPAGLFRNRITIQNVLYAVDSDGGLVASPATTQGTYWAAIDELPFGMQRLARSVGTERYRQEQIRPELMHVVGLREYNSAITEKMRLIFGSRTFEILAVYHDELQYRYTLLSCREIK